MTLTCYFDQCFRKSPKPIPIPISEFDRSSLILFLIETHKLGSSSESSDFEFARSQINDILSTSAPYRLPDDMRLVFKTLTEIAFYARCLENTLWNQKNGMSCGSFSYPLNVKLTLLGLDDNESGSAAELGAMQTQGFSKDSSPRRDK